MQRLTFDVGISVAFDAPTKLSLFHHSNEDFQRIKVKNWPHQLSHI
jgi:hypothetical protein